MIEIATSAGVPRSRLILAFAAIYLVWGSTYLAIRIAIETLPPLIMAGARFTLAGAILYIWMRGRGAAAPKPVHWRSALVIGALLLLGGNGGVVWSEQRVPSGLAALLIATVPLWMTLLAWPLGVSARPSLRVGLGLMLGMAGVTLLVAAPGTGAARAVDPVGALVLVLAALSWALGSLWSRRVPLPASPFVATGMEMMLGGMLLMLAGFLRGEWAAFDPAAVTTRSVLALFYLLLFGSLVGFTAYIYLLGVTTPARVSTYGFVNPVVAVALGWAFAGEALTPRTLVAAAIITTAVVIIVTAGERRRRPQVVAARSEPHPAPTCLDEASRASV